MKYKKSININKCYYDSPIGLLLLKANDLSLLSVAFVQERIFDENINELLKKTVLQLNEYFCGERFIFDLPLEFKGTNFQSKVWKALMQIDYGKTASYKEIAEIINHPKAYRAVGGANNKNKLPIIIPCHRVIGSKGELTGYAGGTWRKEWLLNHETRILGRKNV